MAKDWKKQTRAPIVGMIRNPYFVFTDSFDVGTTPTLLDSKEAQKVINFIRAFMLGRVHITTGNPLKNLMEFHLSKESGMIDLQIKTALINDLDPYLGNHLNLEGYNFDARDVSGSMYQQHGDEGFCISGGQKGGVIRLLGASSNGTQGGSGFSDGGANIIWTLPPNSGSSGQVLSTDGLKTLSWITAGGGGGGSGTVTSVATSSGTFIDITGGNPSPITTTGTISGDLSATGSASDTTFLRGDNTWAAVPSFAPAGGDYEMQMRNPDGTFGASGVWNEGGGGGQGELHFNLCHLGPDHGTEALTLSAADSIIAFTGIPSGDFSQGIHFKYDYRICDSYPTAAAKGLSFVKSIGGGDRCIMDVFAVSPFSGGDNRTVSVGHSQHTRDGSTPNGTFVDIFGGLLLRGANPVSDDYDWVEIQAQTGSEGYVIGLPTSDYSGFGYRKNMAMCIAVHATGTQDLDWANVLITNEDGKAIAGDTGLFFKGWNVVSETTITNPIMNGDVLNLTAGDGVEIDYTTYGLGAGASSTHVFTFSGDAVTEVVAADGTFVNLAGGTITSTGTLTPDLSASGSPDGTTFLRGDNTWAVPAGGGGGSGTVTSVAVDGGTGLTDTGGPITSAGTITINLDDTAVTPATYGDASNVAQITIDQQGRITAASEVAISGGGGGSGTVTSVATSSGTFVDVTGGTITSSGTITGDLSASGSASSSTFLRGDNTWAVPSGGGGGMTSFTISDGVNTFDVEDSETVEFTSSDGYVVLDCSTDGTVDITEGGGPPPPSDERLKKNIESVGGLLEKVEKLKPVEFDWNKEAASTFKKEGHEIGLIAQDVEKIFPDLVGERKGFKTVDYEKLVPMLVDCIKDLSYQVRTLNEKVDDLEFKNLTDQ